MQTSTHRTEEGYDETYFDVATVTETDVDNGDYSYSNPWRTKRNAKTYIKAGR